MDAAGTADDGSTLSRAELQQRYTFLQQRVTRFSVVEQRLIEARAQLDEELGRLARLNEFGTRAITASGPEEFAGLVSEAMVDIYEQQCGFFWLADESGALLPEPASSAGVEGGRDRLRALRHWLSERAAGMSEPGRVVTEEELMTQPGGFDFSHLVIGRCPDAGNRLLAVAATGTFGTKREFHTPLTSGRIAAFRLFLQKVSALLISRRKDAIISMQLQHIRESEERLKLAVESGNTGFWDWDMRAGTIVYSPVWKSMLGYAEADLPDQPGTWHSLLHPDDRDASRQSLHSHLLGATPVFENLARLRHRDGHYVWIMARGRAVRDAAGTVVRFAGTHTDMTRQKELESRLREAEDLQRTAREQAEAASLAKSVFVASISHELRTPMNGVLGMLQLLRETPLSEAQHFLVSNAERSSIALLDVVGEILDLSKIEAGSIVLDCRPFSPRELFEDAMSLMRIRAEAKHLFLELELPDNLPAWLEGDAGRLRQVLINLTGNAVKFTDEGGVRVRVTSRPVPDQGGAADLEVTVRDSGKGFSAELAEKLFEPYQQAGAASQRRDGAGLGLAISRSLARLMNGNIRAASAAGEGAEFYFTVTLPLCPPPPEEAPVSSAPVPEKFAGRVLVVEDSEMSRTVARLMLEKFGLEVSLAVNGAEGVAMAASGTFHLILMDYQMPVMDGLTAARAIRSAEAAEKRPHIPIIALTANVQPTDIAACRSAGMDDFLSKPLRKERLAEKLARHLRQPPHQAGEGELYGEPRE